MAKAMTKVETQVTTTGIARNLEVAAILDLQQQIKALEADVKARRTALLDSMTAEGIEVYDCGDGHVATVVRSTRETLSREKAEELLHPNTLRALIVESSTTYLKVR